MVQYSNLNSKMVRDHYKNMANLKGNENCLLIFRMSKFFLVFLLLFVFRYGFGQEVSSKIDKKDLRTFVKTLTSTQFCGRDIDNEGQKKTQELIINRFKELQIEPFFPEGYLENFSLHQTSRGEIYIKTQNNQKLRNFDRMVFEGAIKQKGEIEKEVVFGGYGTEEELNQIDVEDRFVLIFLINPREETTIKKRLEERNANGLIFFQKDDKNFISMKRQLKEFHLKKRYSIAGRSDTIVHPIDPKFIEMLRNNPTINAIKIPGAEVKNIVGLSKSKLVNLANKKKINEVLPTVISINFEQVEKMIETANVVGVIKGESEKSIVISAHYDHLGKAENLYYPGADDNASGIAALFELAEEFVQYRNLNYTMIFLATTAEESGLLGSRYHVEQPYFTPEKIILNVNIDMISRCDNNHSDCKYLYYIGSKQSEILDSLAIEANKVYPQYTFYYSEAGPDIFARSDGHSFKKKGITSIMFFSGLHDDYHRPTDTMDKINFDILEKRIKLICEFLKLLQKEHFL